MAVQVSVYDGDDNFIAKVPRRKSVQGMEEHNSPGSFSFDLLVNDQLLVEHPTLLDYGNIVRLAINGEQRKACIIEQVRRVNVAEGERAYTVSGRGYLAVLANGTVYPEYTLRRDSADERSFDYGSAQSPVWYDPSQWNTPLGVAKSSTSSIRYPYPRGWPDSFSQWIWSSPGPNVDTPAGYNFFRGGFSLPSETRVAIYAAGDDAMELQLDGEVILQTGYGQWLAPAVWTGSLAAGYHLLASWVYNHGTAGGGQTEGGFICCVAKVDRNGKVLSILKRSAPSGFLVYNEANAPGWFPAAILHKLVNEAEVRGVPGIAPMVYGFTDDEDHDGNPWPQRHNMSVPIGTTDLLDMTQRLTEHEMDVDVSPSLVLRAWRERGVDRTSGPGKVILGPGKVISSEANGSVARVRNNALVRHKRGWINVVDSASQTTYGRRETGLILGGAGSDAQADRTARAGFRDTKDPEVTVSVQMDSTKGPQPWEAFDIYDLVLAQGLSGALEPCRVLSWAFAEEDPTGKIIWDIQLYPETS